MKDFINEVEDDVPHKRYNAMNAPISPYRYKGTDMQNTVQKNAIQMIAVEQAYHMLRSGLWASRHTRVGYTDVASKLLNQYEPMAHLIGIKAVGLNLKDLYNGSVQYPASGLVTCKDFNGLANCGGGLHFSIMHNPNSMSSTLSRKRETEARFQLALLPADRTLVVDNNKLKTPAAMIIHTGSFKEIYGAMRGNFFGSVLSGNSESIVTCPSDW